MNLQQQQAILHSNKNQNHQLYIPVCSVAFLVLSPIILIGSLLTFFSTQATQFYTDAQRVIFAHQWYRIFTAPFAVFSLRQLFTMFFCLLWLWYFLPKYERRFSTLWTIYHFFKFNLIMQLSLLLFYEFLFLVVTLKQFMIISGGIIPYCLYIYLKDAEEQPYETVWCCFSPFPVSKFIRSFIVAVLFIWFSQQTHQCIFILIYWLITRCLCCRCCNCKLQCCFCCDIKCNCRKCICCTFLCIDGPLCTGLFAFLERLVPQRIVESQNFYKIKSNNKSSYSQETEKEMQLDQQS